MSEPWAVAVMVAVLIGAYLLMWRGWLRRGRAQADLPPPNGQLPEGDVRTGPVEGVYVGTTISGDWNARVVVHTLGRRSAASITVTSTGVLIDRSPEPVVAIPAVALRSARIDRAGGGKASRRNEYLILTWAHGDVILDTALRPDHRSDLDGLLRACGAGPLNQGATS